MIGKKFGRLTVIQEVKRSDSGKRRWLCECACGNKKEFIGCNLGRHANSCGCLRKEKLAAKYRTHGGSKERLYAIWLNMKQRCNNPNASGYKYYGGRGIKYASEWSDYQTFRQWAMSNGYEDTLSIDRIDVYGNYEPSNCRWITMEDQAGNKRNAVLLTHEGKTLSQQEWADLKGVNHTLISKRLKRGWSVERALNEKSNYGSE